VRESYEDVCGSGGANMSNLVPMHKGFLNYSTPRLKSIYTEDSHKATLLGLCLKLFACSQEAKKLFFQVVVKRIKLLDE